MFILGKHSRAQLEGVHPQLVGVVQRAIQLTTQDFTVHDGIRTRGEQAEFYRRGVSQTMNSKHLPQADGYGHAVDLVPYIGGQLRWEWEPIYRIAAAMKEAAQERGVHLRWGGCWCKFTLRDESPEDLVAEYISTRRELGLRPFIDGPHYEILL